ncbi:LacI family DNA-binding transcriptional regulator [Pseudonocardia nigra]|uniref:LacI family DNA-binding transcriptional regulator n=1 Tax=Pseudonocardia nigra TaxID=1921578 RepID=UPI001C5F5313|nr:LacI family DNA-binding transcriptional regulator [Pseudonocardia nigra]
MPRTTLADIAAAAGVTVPTVSKVLNGRSDVSAGTRARVLDLLTAAGYERRRPAESVAPSGLVELVLDGVEGSWATRVLGGVQRAAAEAGSDVVVVSVRDERGDGPDWVERVVARGATGAVLALVDPTPAQRDRLAAAGVQLVVLDPGVEPAQGLPSVGTTNWAGGYSAVEHLVSLGHERVAAIGGRADQLNSRARLDGYRSALAAAGARARATWVRHSDWTRAGGLAQARALLSARERPTAVFACSDRLARGVYEAAAERGLRIPDDLSVVGFDDLPEALWLAPRLTTVRQPVREMAAEAVRLLLRLTRGEPAHGDRVELSTTLVVRDSTAPPS